MRALHFYPDPFRILSVTTLLEMAERMSVSAHKVGRWRNRFAEQGFRGIEKNLPQRCRNLPGNWNLGGFFQHGQMMQ
jgi:hypothetical protein